MRYRLYIILVVSLYVPMASFANSGFHPRYDSWMTNIVRYLAVDQPQAFHTSEFPVDRATYLSVTGQQAPGITRYFNARLQREFQFGFQQNQHDKAGFELENRARLSFVNNRKDRDPVRFENDIIGYTELDDHFSIYFDFQYDSDGLHDLDYHGTREWKNVTGDFRAAYATYQAKRWSLLVGRDYVHWGPAHTGSLLTSGYAPALDMIKLTANIWRLNFTAFNAKLNRETDQQEALNLNRYFSGHRLSLKFPNIELGFTETVMYGGPAASLNAGYANPFISYYFSDVMFNEGKHPSNTTLAFDGSLFMPQHVRWYGQFLVDEYYYEGEDFPNQTAVLGGVDWTRPFGWDRLWCSAEYIKVTRWVYNYGQQWWWNRLNYYNTVLGHPIGPDADLLHIQGLFYAGNDVLIRGTADILRRGETTNDTPLIVAHEHGNSNPPFPFGTVETTTTFEMAIEYSPTIDWFLTGAFRFRSVENERHISLKSRGEMSFVLGLQYRVRTFLH